MFVIPFIGPHRRNDDGDATISSNFKDSLEINPDPSTKDVDNLRIKEKNIFQTMWDKFSKAIQHGVNKEVANYQEHLHQEMHDAATKYDPDTERLYSFLQVLTASFASFSHGSNDVANAVGPLAAIYFIYENARVDSAKTPVPLWGLALGGFAIDVG